MVTDARSLARMYAAAVGEVDGVRLLQPGTVQEMCALQQAQRYGVPPEFSVFMAEAFPFSMSSGLVRPDRLRPLLGPASFGHPGYGGSLAFADPDLGVAFGYVRNHLSSDGQTSRSLITAVADCLAGA